MQNLKPTNERKTRKIYILSQFNENNARPASIKRISAMFVLILDIIKHAHIF